jgi:hypothetical protein
MEAAMANSPEGYWLARFVFQRGMALIYLIAFLVALNQFRPLLGERGLLPVQVYINQVSFRDSPSLFFFAPKDAAFMAVAWIGIILSGVALSGFSERYALWMSMGVWAVLWVLYLSFVNVGQIFYGFGWESILLEAGFFTIFLGSNHVPPQRITILILRWVLFRVMFGAGLIKLRGDSCWHDVTCLDYHYETQPMPNPLSWYLHWAPQWTHRGGVCFNHFAELIAPFGYFLPQPIASIAGLVTIAFQGSIMASGNLSWLNLLTIILAIPTLDDRLLQFIPLRAGMLRDPGMAFKGLLIAVAVLVVYLSINPIRNMISPSQVMNRSYNPFHLVGTYGAFGSITRTRNEIVVEGTADAVVSRETNWQAYEFKGKPGDPSRMPPQIAPYHLRLDWLMWFAAMSSYLRNPWFMHFVQKLLEGDEDTLSLLRTNPFPNHPPRYIRARLYEYHFTDPAPRKRTGDWWTRRLVGAYLPPVALDTPGFRALLEDRGWLPRAAQ